MAFYISIAMTLLWSIEISSVTTFSSMATKVKSRLVISASPPSSVNPTPFDVSVSWNHLYLCLVESLESIFSKKKNTSFLKNIQKTSFTNGQSNKFFENCSSKYFHWGFHISSIFLSLSTARSCENLKAWLYGCECIGTWNRYLETENSMPVIIEQWLDLIQGVFLSHVSYFRYLLFWSQEHQSSWHQRFMKRNTMS